MELVPWVECSAVPPANVEAEVGQVRRLLGAWIPLAERAIVTVDVGRVRDMLGALARHTPLRIVPGLKVSPLLTKYRTVEDEALWREVDRARELAQRMTGSREYLLDLESALWPHMRGRRKDDGTVELVPLSGMKVRRALGNLGGEPLWYPALDVNPEIGARYMRLARAIGDRVRFVDTASYYARVELSRPETARAVRELESVTDATPLRVAYCCYEGDAPRQWAVTELREWLPAAAQHEHELVIYPGRASMQRVALGLVGH